MRQEGVDQMKAHRKLALGLVIGIGSVAMFGAAALGAFGLEVSSSVGSAIAPVGSVLGAEKPDKFKGILDALVQKGEITSLVDRTWPTRPTPAGRAPNLKSFLGEMSMTAQTFLGLSATDIATVLRNGQSLGELANATKPNGRDGLIAALTLSANTRIDKAAADKKITTDQATTLKSKVGAAITTFVDRKFPVRSSTKPASPANGTTPTAPTTTKPTTPASPSPTPKEDR